MRTPEGRRPLSELRVGDQVLARDQASGALVYSEVLMFIDRMPDERRQFLRLRTAGNRTLTLTPAHLVPVVRHRPVDGSNDISNDIADEEGGDSAAAGQLVREEDAVATMEFAERVAVGDRVLVPGATKHDRQAGAVLDTVVDVELVLRRGVFAPLTRAGTVVVDDVVASCYAVIDSQRAAHWAFAPLRAWFNLRDAVHRLALLVSRPTADPDAVSSSRTPAAEPQPQGVHWYADALYALARNVLPSTWLHE